MDSHLRDSISDPSLPTKLFSLKSLSLSSIGYYRPHYPVSRKLTRFSPRAYGPGCLTSCGYEARLLHRWECRKGRSFFLNTTCHTPRAPTSPPRSTRRPFSRSTEWVSGLPRPSASEKGTTCERLRKFTSHIRSACCTAH